MTRKTTIDAKIRNFRDRINSIIEEWDEMFPDGDLPQPVEDYDRQEMEPGELPLRGVRRYLSEVHGSLDRHAETDRSNRVVKPR